MNEKLSYVDKPTLGAGLPEQTPVNESTPQSYGSALAEQLLERTRMLRDKTEELEAIIAEQKLREEELHISQKRYEVAIQVSNITMFEYNILTKQFILTEDDMMTYGMPSVVENGVETFVSKGIIDPNYADCFREMYQRVDSGEPFAKCVITARDTEADLHYLELSLTTVYDNSGVPIRAIGVRKNISQIHHLQRENEFGKTLVADKHFACEADITVDRMISMDETWTRELDIGLYTPFSITMETLCRKLVAAEHQELMRQKVCRAYIEEVFNSGTQQIFFQYKRLACNDEYHWHEATVNIIRDETTGHICIRYYTDDINARREKKLIVTDERRLYENMLAYAAPVYEVNLTKNLFISGHESWNKLFGIEVNNNYSEMIDEVLEKGIHPDDAAGFRDCYLRENALNSFVQGNPHICCEYRRPNENGDFIWVRCTYRLHEDLHIGDIHGYAYVEDINTQKMAELALRYKAEHDSLTGFYNKAMSEKLIRDFLSTSDAKARKHAFIMIDIDYFKSINDTFGHVFGDAVLSQTTGKIATLFRDDDILGRVGGDEFVVFMKNIYSSKIAIAKAEEIRTLLCQNYSQRGKSYQISASIGIAIYPAHGKQYDDLYSHSDSALYAAKNSGRNQAALYNDTMRGTASDTDFDPLGLLELRTFEDSISNYVFRILYESADKEASIDTVLELLGKHLNVSRVYIFEDSPDHAYVTNTYEWCDDGIEPQKMNLHAIPYSELGDYKKNFNRDGIFYMPDINSAPEEVRRTLLPQKVKSMLQLAIVKNNEITGFIGFDQCDRLRSPTRKEISDCHSIAQIVGVFITEMRIQHKNQRMENLAMSIVNALDSYAYVCDPTDHTLLFINDSTLEISPGASVGQKCYRAFWARESPCEVCPMRSLAGTYQTKYSMEIYNTNLKIWVRSTASWIDWADSGSVCLVDSVDVTQYKQSSHS